MNQFKKTGANNRGFTVIEVIAVLIIIGVLTAIALSRASSSQEVNLVTEADMVKSHLRFAQLKAMQDDDINDTWGITFAPNSYSLTCTGPNCPATLQLPSESSGTHLFPSGVSGTAAAVTFDSWGGPVGGGTAITLSQGGNSRTITIAAGTGFIP